MHEWDEIEEALADHAEEIVSEFADGYEAIVIVPGSDDGPDRTMTGSSFERGRLRELLGILQTAIQDIDKKDQRLSNNAEDIANEFADDTEVVVIVSGSGNGSNGTLIGSSFGDGHRRDLLGILQTVIQIESKKHFKPDE